MIMEDELQDILHTEIPITRAMGIRVVQATSQSVTLSAPLQNNRNHKHTAFGGSLYSVAVLSGWGLLYLFLRERGISAHIVIQESRVFYSRPVTDVIIATCSLESAPAQERFMKAFVRNGKARMELSSRILQNGQEAMRFEGKYVIHR